MRFFVVVDPDSQIVRLTSPLPFKLCEEKRTEGAIAVCAATYAMADGSFDYDIATGEVGFRMTSSFRGSKLGEKLFQYMISCSIAMADKNNDTFLALDKGLSVSKAF